MQFKTIFWDCDGTLVNTEYLYFESTKSVLASAGVHITREWYVNEMLKKGASSMAYALSQGIPEAEVQRLRTIRNGDYLELLKKYVPVNDGVIQTLDRLHKKVPMGIVTAALRMHFEQIMKTTGLGKYFDFSICADDVTNIKPNPEAYLRAWEQSGFEKEDCLAIEDTEHGLTAAKAAGLTCFACPTEFSHTNDFSAADTILTNVREILPHFSS
ncbi:MAG: HAD family hydrolase [Parcubacteria group bacterium Gr01-1014_8]|nr:MAG: HAD family hydrolase [Parcubacteria group bacterium Gr01-1014_8]